ncbi:MAG: ATP-binding protein, partial [Halobacteriota archaeon]
MRIHEASVDRYGPLAACSPTCDAGLTVISGPNESGKTLFLEAIVQLLDPRVANVLEPPLRVDQTPTGRVVLEHDGERYELPGETTIDELADITPSTLRTVFVVRDTDLAMPDDEDYYTRLIEHLGDIHTSEIDDLIGELRVMGRLTPTRLNLSSQFDDAKETAEGARSLIEQIESYLEHIEIEGLDELHGERLRVERELRATADELEHQRRARAVHEHDRLVNQLDTYRDANARLDELEEFTADALESLRETRDDIGRHERRLDELDGREAETRSDLTSRVERRDQLERDIQRLEARRGDVDDAREALARYRRRADRVPAARRQLGVAKRAVVAGILGAGVVVGAGALTESMAALGFAAVLIVLTLLAGGVFYRANATLSAVEGDEAASVAAARDAGLEVDGIDGVAAAIESFEARLDDSRREHTKVVASVEHLEDTLEDIEAERSAVTETLESDARSLRERLESAGVDDIETFEGRVDRRHELERERDLA